MGITKHELFTTAQNRLAELARAIGHPARIAILQELLRRQTCICGDLVDVLPLSQATVSQHLKALKNAGIIQGNISGASICYCIDPVVWQETGEMLEKFFIDPKNCC